MMSHHNKLFETAEIAFRELNIIYNICQLPYNIFIDKRRQETEEIHVEFIVAIVIYRLRTSKQFVSLGLSLFLRNW